MLRHFVKFGVETTLGPFAANYLFFISVRVINDVENWVWNEES
jgi:hypothetical protein